MCKLGLSLLVVCLPLAAGNTYGRLPLSFEPNQGQTDARVKFLARASGYTLFVTADEAVFAGRDGSVERMKLLGANPKPRFEPLDKQPGISNYFIGNDPSKWRTNIANYGKMALREVYPGIDLIFYGKERQLEYDWVVAPGADPKLIRVKWEGPSQVTMNAGGDLVLSASLVQRKPTILQDGRPIEGGYAVRGREVAFKLAKYDAAKPLVIDPVLVYSTYLGGSGNDQGHIAIDSSGNAYVTGYTASTNFPTTKPMQASNGGVSDAFVTKINASGSARVYSTYLGGSGDDNGQSIAVDGSGNAYVTGYTFSTNFPTTSALQASNGGGSDTFVTKINAAGSVLVYSTYLGGSGDDNGQSIAVDDSGNAYVTGYTASTNFPTTSALQASKGGANDAFVLAIFEPVQVSSAQFMPVTPCRIADTRNPNGPFGGPAIAGGTYRDFVIPNSACGIPSTAVGYSVNVAVVPRGTLGFLTLWPSGQSQPLVATLNSIDGRVKSNAAIVPAGSSGAVSVFATDATDVILDINGYFVAVSNPAALAFYPLTPCRIADTRNPTAPLGGPSLAAQGTRSFPILASSCGLPASAQAYSLNFAAVPKGPQLGFLTAWPVGQSRPLVASLNDPSGTVAANAVVVPAGANGDVNVFTTDATDLVIDINGYFAPQGLGGLSLYTVTPCRVLDSRLPAGSSPFNTTRDVDVTGSPCGIPPTAQAFVFNATVVPAGSLGFITMWPQGQPQPLAATLNAYDGAITNNMAIVPTTTGSISVFPSNPTHLVLDIFGYFAP